LSTRGIRLAHFKVVFLMQIKSLKIFCDVVARRSFSRAADENGISQSGASQVVHQLEHRLGLKLIDRSKRPFVLTPEGEAYYEGCRRLVQRYYALEEEVRTPQKEVAGKVSVASIYSVGLSHMNDCVQHFLSQYPKANVRVQYEPPPRVHHLLGTDQEDLRLVSYPRSSRTITATAWREEPMVLVCSPRHVLAGRKSISLSDLDGTKMVSYDDDLPIRREIDRAIASHRIEVEIVMEFDNVETLKRAIEIDAGIGLLPGPTVVHEVAMGTLVEVPLSGDPLVRPLGIIRRRGKELGKTALRFIQLLNERALVAAAIDDKLTERDHSRNGGAQRDTRRTPRPPSPAAAVDVSKV
jgi:DNA-binding transcriptional LysR family regulator